MKHHARCGANSLAERGAANDNIKKQVQDADTRADFLDGCLFGIQLRD
jgi:hypothetical protein